MSRNDLPQASATNFGARLRETMMTYLGKQGDPLDRGLTLRDMVDNGLVKIKDGFALVSGQAGGTLPLQVGAKITPEPDLTPPPAPSGLKVSAGIDFVMVEHDAPVYTLGHGHLRTHVYGVKVSAGDPLPTFDKAVEVGQFSGQVWALSCDPGSTWRLWAKWETADGVISATPAGGTNGLEAVTGKDVRSLVLAMTGPGNPFKLVTEPITLADGTKVPAGVYMADAFIHRMQVVTAMIADAAITNAKIKDLSADKIKAGAIAVGEVISSANYVAGKSGWSISGNGAAEFSNVTVRGTVYATAGELGGLIVGAASLRTANFSSGQTGWMIGSNGYAEFNYIKVRGEIAGGDFTGWAWPAVGKSGFYLGPSGLLLGNANNGKFFQVTADGQVYAPGFRIENGRAYFSGELSAGIVRADNIISNSATNFQQSTIWVPNGGWQSASFYMHHAGIVAVMSMNNFYFSGSSASWEVKLGIDYQGGNNMRGNYYSSSGPPSVGLMNYAWLSQGWHNVWVYMSHSAANSSGHNSYLMILRSYR